MHITFICLGKIKKAICTNVTITVYTYVDSVQIWMCWFLFFFTYTPKTKAYGKKSLEVQDSMQIKNAKKPKHTPQTSKNPLCAIHLLHMYE